MWGNKKEDPMHLLKIVSQLIDYGIYEVRADFDGQGDEGEIHELSYYDIDHSYITDDVNLLPFNMEDFMYDKIEDLVNEYGGDWVNNDGGYGTISFYPYHKKFKGEYSQRTIDQYVWDDPEQLFT